MKTCKKCRYFKDCGLDTGLGECRYNPPVIVSSLVNYTQYEFHEEMALYEATHFPTVYHDWWCAKHDENYATKYDGFSKTVA